MSEEFSYWCIVCKELKIFPHVAAYVMADYRAGGWYCGYHTEAEIKAASSSSVYLDRGKRSYPKEGGDVHAPQEGKVQENHQFEHQRVKELGKTPKASRSHRSSESWKEAEEETLVIPDQDGQ